MLATYSLECLVWVCSRAFKPTFHSVAPRLHHCMSSSLLQYKQATHGLWSSAGLNMPIHPQFYRPAIWTNKVGQGDLVLMCDQDSPVGLCHRRRKRGAISPQPERWGGAINDKCPPTCGGVCASDSTANMHVQHHVTLIRWTQRPAETTWQAVRCRFLCHPALWSLLTPCVMHMLACEGIWYYTRGPWLAW